MLLFSRVIRLFSMLAMVFVLASCGGGGTGSPLDNNSGGGDPTDPGDDSSVLSGSVQMTMEDESNPGVEINSISSTVPGLLLITLLDDDGDPVANEIIQLEVVLGAGELSASTALTNGSGVASVNVNVATGDSPGAGGTVRAWYEANSGDTVEGFYNYEVVNSGTTSTAGFSVAIELYETGVDISSGTPVGVATNTVSSANPGTLVVIVTDTITDNPISNAIVAVATDVGVLVPDSGRVLTNANGIATITVTSESTAAAGAGTLVATVDDVIVTRNFAVGSVPLQLGRDANGYTDVINNLDFVVGEITISNNNLAAAGSTALRVVVADENGDVYTQPVTVNFTSPCSIAGDANLDTGITTTGGIAVATYEAAGCSGTDNVTAVIEDVSGASASGSITIAASVANSIRFISATPEFISIKGTGTDSADLVFEVVDQDGVPQAGEDVTFTLSTTLGGITLTNSSASTNASGQVTATVNSGTVSTPVRVVASITVGGETITTVSEALTISTGLPDQDSFSLSASTLNPGGNDFDGVESILTIRAGDAFNNPVPDGTTINFITEYGRVTNPDEDTPTAACQTTNGTCSVVWNSQSPRSATYPVGAGSSPPLRLSDSNHICNDPDPDFTAVNLSGVPCIVPLEDQAGGGAEADFPGQVYGSRSTVLAYAVGEETFVDANGNGLYDYIDQAGGTDDVYDPGIDILESFTDLPEAYIDYNEDGVFGNINSVGGCIADAANASATAEECAGWEEGGELEEHIDLIDNDDYDGDEGSPAGGDLVTRTGFGNGIYNGSLCSDELAALSPPRCTTTLVNVRDSLTLIAGGATAWVGFYDGSGDYLDPSLGEHHVDISGGGTDTRQIYIADVFNGYLPAGTTITIASNNCKVFGITEYEIQDTNTFGIFTFSLSFAEDTTTDNSSDTIDIEITPPDGVGGGVVNTGFICTDAD